MKINWGTGIVIAFAIFISFILFMVITMSTDKKYNHDLVTPDYYQKELAYQDEIDAEENANKLSSKVKVEKTSQGILLTFPEELKDKNLKGTVSLYRPSNKKLDFNLSLNVSNAQMLIPENRLLEGRWDIIINWEDEGKKYMFKDKIFY
jgi:nitrogen fixation protein FixH